MPGKPLLPLHGFRDGRVIAIPAGCGMTKVEITRLQNLIAKKAKFADKFTKSDATTLKNLQAKNKG